MEWLLKHIGILQILHMDYPFLLFPQFYSFNGTILNHSVQSKLMLRTLWGQVRISQTRKSGLKKKIIIIINKKIKENQVWRVLTHSFTDWHRGFEAYLRLSCGTPRISFIEGITVSSLVESVSGNVKLECATYLRPKPRGGASKSSETLLSLVCLLLSFFFKEEGWGI